MAEFNTAEELDDINEIEYGADALTGGQDKRMYLYYQLCCTGFAINNKVCWCADESS